MGVNKVDGSISVSSLLYDSFRVDDDDDAAAAEIGGGEGEVEEVD